jgi:hypothetical protein
MDGVPGEFSRAAVQARSSWWTRWNDTPTASPMSRRGTWSALSLRTRSAVNAATLRSASRAASLLVLVLVLRDAHRREVYDR